MSKDHVPAWKRLGLKLKFAKEAPQPITTTNGSPSIKSTTESPPSKKRKAETTSAPPKPSINGEATPAKSSETSSKKVKKQVSFTSDTKTTDGDTAVSIIPSEQAEQILRPEPSKKKSKKQSQSNGQSTPKSESTLEYLTQFYRTNATWKFNKNREIWILKHAFSLQDIPLSYNLALAQYIHGLQSQNARDRLRMDCMTASVGQTHETPHEWDESCQNEAEAALKAFPDTPVAEGAKLNQTLSRLPRPQLVLWALDPTQAPITTKQSNQQPRVQKKRKNRTAVVEYSSSSSESSESESETSDSSSSDSSSDGD